MPEAGSAADACEAEAASSSSFQTASWAFLPGPFRNIAAAWGRIPELVERAASLLHSQSVH